MSTTQLSPTVIESGSQSKLPIIMDILGVLIAFVVIKVITNPIQQWGVLLGLIVAFGNVLRVILASWLLHRQGLTWTELGVRRPERLLSTLLMGVGAGVAGLILFGLLQSFMATVFPNVVPPNTSLFDTMRGNSSLLIFTLILVWSFIAIGEELTWRVFMINRFSALFDGKNSFPLVGLAASVIVFGLIHSYQGLNGIISTGVQGLVFGLAYLLTKKNIWVAVIAHGVVNTISFLSLYGML